MGCLVAASASLAEPGLVVVMPLTGKITYWESITSAAALDLIRQQRLGVEGTVGSLFSGETIVQIENAEPAGFILSFSSGRIALLSVRDGQGRPSISVQFIKSTGTGTTGGFFGGLKNVFGTGAWRRDVAAVRSGPSKRGSRTVGMATAAGILQVWDVQRGGHHSLQCEADVKQDMMAAIKRVEPELQSKASEDFELIDFNFVPESSRGDELSLQNETSKAKMMVLAAFRGTNSSYTLVEVSIARNTATFGLIQPIRCYTSPTPSNSLRRPRLYLPQPRHTAFIVFERAVVVASLVRIAESPDQQLLSDSHELLEPFEDVVDFREGLDSSIVGSNAEEGREPEAPAAEDGKPARRRTRDPACVLLVRGGGVVRVTAYAPPKDPREAEAATVQSKIEQAIHYGGEAQNPLNFAGRHETQFPLEEVEAAALQVSHDIVDSQSKAVTLVAPSMDYQLKQRAAALRQLAVYLRDTFPPLSRLTKWQLLWDAEKLAAARGVWKLYDTRLREKVSSKQYALLAQLVDMMNEELNEQAREDIGELDRVRHWFVRNVSRIQYMVVWAYNSVSEIQQAGRKDMATLTGLVSEANDISLGALETAFRFRRENLSLYGLENEVHQDGVLLKGYEALPEFWTSIHLIVTSTKALVDLSRELAINYWKKDKEVGAPDPKVIQKIGEENVRQVEVCCQVYQERFRWCLVQDDDRLRSEGRALKQLHLGVRKGQIGRLSFLDQTDAAIVLAEKYHVMQTLVQLLADEIGSLGARSEQHGLSEEDAAMLEDRMASLEGRLAANFRTFGDDWARALFTEHIKKGQLSTLMNDNDEWSQYLTRFLRGNPAYAKLSWMNDVIVEKDFDLASQALLEFARNKENDLWAKRVELSIGKLAKLSAHENQEQSETEVDEFDWVDDELDIVTIQQRLYEHISPVLHAALDGKAELDLAMTELGKRTKGNKPALNKVLQQGLADLLAHNSLGVAQLIDVLTLLDPYFDAEAPDAIAGQEFHLALRALRLGGEDDKTDADLNEKIIWRRCMIRDDWAAINDTQLKDDKALERATSGTALFRTSKAGYIAGMSMHSNSTILSYPFYHTHSWQILQTADHVSGLYDPPRYLALAVLPVTLPLDFQRTCARRWLLTCGKKTLNYASTLTAVGWRTGFKASGKLPRRASSTTVSQRKQRRSG